jgi:hypothetical protein
MSLKGQTTIAERTDARQSVCEIAEALGRHRAGCKLPDGVQSTGMRGETYQFISVR